MAIVIADTSPLQYLFQIELLHILPDLFGTIWVPEAVRDELHAGRSLGFDVPDPVAFPWMLVQPTPATTVVNDVELGPGERSALVLALGTRESLVLLDDAAARAAAKRLGVSTTGTLGVLLLAKEQRLIAVVAPLIARLEERGFRIAEPVRRHVLQLAAEWSE